jgi:hypothetical protein
MKKKKQKFWLNQIKKMDRKRLTKGQPLFYALGKHKFPAGSEFSVAGNLCLKI